MDLVTGQSLAQALTAGPMSAEQVIALAVAGFLTGLAREYGDLMVLVDDVQWLDPGSRRVLALLSFELDTIPALVVMTAGCDRYPVPASPRPPSNPDPACREPTPSNTSHRYIPTTHPYSCRESLF
jgi:hypothetical protein